MHVPADIDRAYLGRLVAAVERGAAHLDANAAACRGMDTGRFYLADPPSDVQAACARCTQRDLCLATALANQEPGGYWGGTTAAQRVWLTAAASVRDSGLDRCVDAVAYRDAITAIAAWVAVHGNAAVPYRADLYGVPVGKTVGRLRRLHRDGALPAAISRWLEQLPGWVWDQRSHHWDDAVRRVETFRARHGHTNIPFHHTDPDGFALGGWAARQRHALRHGALTGGRATQIAALFDEQRPVQQAVGAAHNE